MDADLVCFLWALLVLGLEEELLESLGFGVEVGFELWVEVADVSTEDRYQPFNYIWIAPASKAAHFQASFQNANNPLEQIDQNPNLWVIQLFPSIPFLQEVVQVQFSGQPQQVHDVVTADILKEV